MVVQYSLVVKQSYLHQKDVAFDVELTATTIFFLFPLKPLVKEIIKVKKKKRKEIRVKTECFNRYAFLFRADKYEKLTLSLSGWPKVATLVFSTV